MAVAAQCLFFDVDEVLEGIFSPFSDVTDDVVFLAYVIELGETVHVISTGGFGGPMAAEVPAIEAYEPHLVLEGLRIIHNRNKNA